MKANEYGIRNLRRVMEHILDWTRQPDGRHDDLQSIYNAVRAQYIKYVWFLVLLNCLKLVTRQIRLSFLKSTVR